MRIVNWNVNSVRTRIDRVTEFLARHDVDVLAVQETKCKDEQFPYERFEEMGYHVAHFGLSQFPRGPRGYPDSLPWPAGL